MAFYKAYRINEINNDDISKYIFHMYVNSTPCDVMKMIQRAVINTGKKIKYDGLVGSSTLDAINMIDREGNSAKLKKNLVKERLLFEEGLKDSAKYPGRAARFKRL